MRLRIVSNPFNDCGIVGWTKVYDLDTGCEFHNIRSLSFDASCDGLPTLTLTFIPEELEIECEAPGLDTEPKGYPLSKSGPTPS